MKKAVFAAGVVWVAVSGLLVVPAAGSSAAVDPRSGQQQADRPGNDTVPGKYSTAGLGEVRTADRPVRAAASTPPVGTVRGWLGLDEALGQLYRKDYTLRAVGQRVEIWVANDTSFPAGDCRNGVPGSTFVTDEQLAYLAGEFDSTVYPIETATFSTPPDRDGTNALLDGDFTGDGDNTVLLVDNIRDDDYYGVTVSAEANPGFFSAQYNELLDRNVVTLDAFDWEHSTTNRPPSAPTDDPCTSRPARSHFYEGVLAAEWHQLLLYYVDPNETTWLTEGLSQVARSLTGYANSKAPVPRRRAAIELVCFQGFGAVPTEYKPDPRDCGGAENSLNLWDEDGSPDGVLADRGHAWALLQFLSDRYGTDVLTRLHQDGARQGLASLFAALDAEGVTDAYEVIHDFQSMVYLDALVGAPTPGRVLGVPKQRVTTPSLRPTVNLANPDSYDDAGAAPNGADYVSLQTAGGTWLRGDELQSFAFEGATTLPPTPLGWTLVNDDPDSPGDSVLFSGNSNNLDVSAVTSVTVPVVDPTLRFDAKYGAEFGYDYGYVVVSTDGGESYAAVVGDKTVPGPEGPALNGTTDGFEPHTFDLAAYAGQTVLIGFRYVTDGGVNEGGLLVDDVTVGGVLVSDGSSLAPFDSPTEINPVEVANWNVRLIGTDPGRPAVARQLAIDGQHSFALSPAELDTFSRFDVVMAIVAYDEPTEQHPDYAPYTLTVNDVVQPGG